MALQKVKRFSGSLYRRVCFQKGCGYGKGENTLKKPWYAYIFDNNKKRHHLGYFQTMNEAGIAYNEASLKIFGKDAILNTIIDTPESTTKNPLWLKSKRGVYWRSLSKTQIVQRVRQNITIKNKDDYELIALFIEGDESAFGKLVTKYYNYWIDGVEFEYKKMKKLRRKNMDKELRMEYADFVSEGVMKCIRLLKAGKFGGINHKDWIFKMWVSRFCRYALFDFLSKENDAPSWSARHIYKNPRGRHRVLGSIYDDYKNGIK